MLRNIFGRAIAVTLAMTGPAAAVVGPTVEPGALASHVVMVLKRSAEGAGFCSGLVLGQDVVLTAAHCVARPADLRVHYRDAAEQPVLAEVAEVDVHPGFRADAVHARVRSIDLALIRLAAPLPRRFAPAEVSARAGAQIGDRFRIVGFGFSREGVATTGGTLRSAVLAARAPLSSVLLWAQGADGKPAGACTGDSGAPVFGENEDSAFAIASWAAGDGKARCGNLTQAVLLAPQRAWIERILADWARR